MTQTEARIAAHHGETVAARVSHLIATEVSTADLQAQRRATRDPADRTALAIALELHGSDC